MQQVSVGAKKELIEFLEKAENRYVEDTFSVAEHKAFMENCLHQWYITSLFTYNSLHKTREEGA